MNNNENNFEIDKSGNKFWYNKNGLYHREDGPAVEYSTGGKSWYINGRSHRVDGPAIIWSNGDQSWYQNGLLHREDGPAIENVYGRKVWYIKGQEIDCTTQEQFEKLMRLKAFW